MTNGSDERVFSRLITTIRTVAEIGSALELFTNLRYYNILERLNIRINIDFYNLIILINIGFIRIIIDFIRIVLGLNSDSLNRPYYY
jgi:hypothetical protein